MKFWNEFQVFFVYDTKQCLREEDDPKDAIIYFHPPDTADNIRCGLCCQLMGMAQFCSTVFSNATFIHLQRNKFALKNLGRYILALGGNLSMPDNVLKRQLNSLYEIFEFYHKSIEEVERLMPASTELTFHDKMSEIWKCYLPVSQHFGNTLSLTFGILPSLDLPKSGGCIFMKASQILQLCQSKSEVYSGCILTNNQVLCSQMSPSIVRHIYFISSTKPQMPANYVTTPLPAGVTIFYVYVKKNLLQDEMEKNYLYKGSHFAHSATIEKEERDKTSCNNSDTLSGKEEETASCLSESESLVEHNNIHENHCTDTEHSNGFDEKLDQTQTTEDEIIKACLYIQGHSNTQLILLTSEVVAHNMKIIDFLWRTGLSSLVDLEMDIKNLIENHPKQEKSKDYCYLQFDHTLKCIKIDEMIPMCPSDPAEQLFNRTVQLMHEMFMEDPVLEESSLIFANSAVYGHKLASLETYFQEMLKRPTLTSMFSAVDIVTQVQASGRHKLEKDRGIMLV